MPSKKSKMRFIFICLVCVICGVLIYFGLGIGNNSVKYSILDTTPIDTIPDDIKPIDEGIAPELPLSTSSAPVTHISTPSSVKAVYVSSWTAGSQKYRDPIIKMIDDTELNAIVIDVKDSTGRIGFAVSDPELQKMGTTENRIPNVRALTNLLHEKNIYIIGRVSVFQDPVLTKLKPDWAVTKKSDDTVWKDKKGLSFLDPANKEVWKYVVRIANDAYAQGFDEINFDYIRYPSDGNLQDINYRLKEGETRSDNIEKFFIYLASEMKKDQNIPISADVFGLTTEVNNDMGIGQVWEKALPHFDFLSPMIYPSHYPSGHNGFKNPAEHPYDVINSALVSAVNRTKAQNQPISKIRPWLQDFDLGATYTKELVQAQMKASYNNGIDSWMLWDPRNKYTPSALELEIKR